MSRLGRGFPNNALSWQLPPLRASVTFDATGAGAASPSTATTLSWSHTPTAGAYVVVDFFTDRTTTVTAATFGGVTMPLLSSVTLSSGLSGLGVLYRYGISNVSGGAHTVAFTISTAARIVGGSVSYLKVLSTSSATSSGTTSPASQAITCSNGQMAIQSFVGWVNSGATQTWTPSGGTNRYNIGATNEGLVASDAAGSTTFSASMSPLTAWGGISTILSP